MRASLAVRVRADGGGACDGPAPDRHGPVALADVSRNRRTHPKGGSTVGVRDFERDPTLWASPGVRRANHTRPATRGECAQGVRPCPYVGCKYHLWLDVNEAGGVRLNKPDVPPWQLEPSCALDVADEGGTSLEEVGRAMNLCRERVRQIEELALWKLRGFVELREHLDPRGFIGRLLTMLDADDEEDDLGEG